MKKVFDNADVNSDGKLSLEEWREAQPNVFLPANSVIDVFGSDRNFF